MINLLAWQSFARRFGVDTGDSYRAEMRTPGGQVKGVYSWRRPDGTEKIISYASDENGFRNV